MKLALFGVIFQQFISFASGLIVARLIGAAEYGIFSLARNLQQIVGLFSRIGFDVGLQRFIGEVGANPELRSRRLMVIFRFRLIAFGLSLMPLILLVFGAGNLIEKHLYKYESFSSVLVFTFVAIPFLSDIAVLGGVYRGLVNPAPAIKAEYILLPSIRLLVILILFALGYRLWAVIIGGIIAATFASIFLAINFRGLLKSATLSANGVVDKDIVGPTIKYSFVIACAMSVTMLTRSVDSFFLGYYTSATEIGQYALVQMMLILVGLFGAAIGQTLGAQIAERFAAKDNVGIEYLLERNVRLIALVSCPMFAVFFFWGSDLILLFGPSYALPIAVVRWLSSGALLLTLTACAGFALSMTGRHTLELKILIFGLLVSISLCATLVPRFGQTGASVAVFASLAVANLVRLYVVWRDMGVFHLRWSHLQILIIALLISFPLSFTAGGESYERVFRAVAGVTVYFLIYITVVWKLLNQSDRDLFRNVFARRIGRN